MMKKMKKKKKKKKKGEEKIKKNLWIEGYNNEMRNISNRIESFIYFNLDIQPKTKWNKKKSKKTNK